MKASEYIQKYTSGERIVAKHIWNEFWELLIELFKANPKGMEEEFKDTIHFIQLWLYWKFRLNGEMWKITQSSLDKFISRVSVWQEIYAHVGLPRNISGFAGNYLKIEKVIKHLSKFEISEERSREAYATIIAKKR